MISEIGAVLLLGICCFPQVGYGQGNEVSLSLGGIESYSQGNSLFCEAVPTCGVPSAVFNINTGFAIQGAFAHRLVGVGVASLDLELPILAVPTRGVPSVNGIAPGDLSSVFFTPSLKLRILTKAPVSPFVSAGGGLAHYSVNSTTTNKGAFAAGGGVDFKTPVPLIRLRVEVRDVISGEPNFGPGTTTENTVRQNLFFGGGIALRF